MINLLLIVLVGCLCETIDSAIGMGYGTILSPLLILFGYPPEVAVSAVLISQAMGGLLAAWSHHRQENASFTIHSRDLWASIWIGFLGVVATCAAAVINLSFGARNVRLYIAILVTAVGLLLLCGLRFKLSPLKLAFIGILSAFNKGISGGGFGPLVTGGQMIVGQATKTAVAATTLAEAPICIAGFLMYCHIGGTINEELCAALCIGSLLGAPLGARITKKLKYERTLVGAVCLLLGVISLIKLFW